jgi:broad specificity phosphatase PhoE
MINMDPSRETLGFLVRHGELTDMGVWDGWGSLGLSDEGCQQAEAAARWLSFEKIGRVVSSDVPRTIQTAQFLMDTGCVECPFVAHETNLRPWMVAGFTGQKKTPERLAEFKKYLDDPTLVIPDGESHAQFEARVQVLFQYLLAPYKALPTAFFVHNSVIKAIMGIPDVKESVKPGGIVKISMDTAGKVYFDVVLGHVSPEVGVS